MASHGLFSLALLLSFLCMTAKGEGDLPTLQITNVFPRTYLLTPLLVQVRTLEGKTIGERILNVSDSFQVSIPTNAIHLLHGEIRGSTATLHGFEPSRDAGHGKIFWHIKEDGFFLSYDNAHFTKIDGWQSD